MNQAYIFIGSNIDRRKNYITALKRLTRLGKLAATSSVYETGAVGNRAGADFYNGAVLLETPLSAEAVKRRLRQIEAEMGRQRTGNRYAPRTIDLDLVLYNRDLITSPDLRIPDPLILERPFLAQTLAEISPDYVHPSDGRTLAQIAEGLVSRPSAMRLEPDMTNEAKKIVEASYTGEFTHA